MLPVVVGVGVMIGLIAGRSGMPVAPNSTPAPEAIAQRSDQPAKVETTSVVQTVAPRVEAKPGAAPAAETDSTSESIEEAGIVPQLSEKDFYQMAETNPAAAVKLAHSLDATNRSNGMMENLVQKWAGADLTTAAGWVESQTQGEERDRLLERVAFVQGDTDPASALQMVANKISPGPIQDEASMSVLHQELEQDFYTGSGWLDTLFPEGSPLHDRAQQEIAGWALYKQDLSADGGK